VASRVLLTSQVGLADVLALPAAGRYTIEFAQQEGQPTSFRATGDPATWVPIAPGLDTDSGFAMIDLIADRNGKPVAGYVRTGVSNGLNTTTVLLRRWNGTAWETVGRDYAVPTPCNAGSKVMAFAFDSTNAPVLAYGASPTGANSATYVKRFSAGAWQDVGTSGGQLPQVSAFSGACLQPPRLVIDAADRPIVAYRSDNAIFVQRFANGGWADLAATPSFDSIFGAFDLALDPAGTPYFILATNNVATVRKFVAATTSWVGVGANGGVLPQTNTSGLSGMRIRFDANGQPVIASFASIGFGTTFTGAIAYRFDGTAWSSSPGFSLPNSYINNTFEVASAMEPGGGLLMSWLNQSSDIGTAMVVQRNTGPSSWAPVGGGLGQVAQYWAHGLVPDAAPLDSRLLVVGGETYLSVIVHTPAGGIQLVLLRKVGP
jgi:hypothetical protein